MSTSLIAIGGENIIAYCGQMNAELETAIAEALKFAVVQGFIAGVMATVIVAVGYVYMTRYTK